ncbi:hypothetical protein PAAG_12528 [Paracoccidioides lutzii Pb01]|uniref:Uncharacterized protein n=1 Tax=Paracoccidioides lutzii (strain ATCC MYA-826 / Pb01) TaxID=502779 RepID=A0A0A2V3S6_PARBA|nr:hypothetical protein PAAG_12528 [Paracoccidioides lutzii Pb01]KGQ00800.1 hypothetical protein PAAG_12528 [Paracoccidioides lutzii Pb01]
MVAFALKHPKTRELTGGDLLAQSLKTCRRRSDLWTSWRSSRRFSLGLDFDRQGKSSNTLPALEDPGDRWQIDPLILCITSSPPLRDAENNSLQGVIDQIVVSKPLTKFACRMTNPEDTQDYFTCYPCCDVWRSR